MSTVAGAESRRFASLYALANVGAFLCFIPLIGLLLPQRAMELAPGEGVRWLSWILLAGAVGSSVANIAAGWLSDRLVPRHGSRIPMVGIGLAATMMSFVLLAFAASPVALLLAFLLFQLCFNLLFSPFYALASDHIGDAVKGRVFGLLSLGLPLAQLSIVAIVALELDGMPVRLVVISVAVILTMLPLLLFGRSAAGAPIAPQSSATSDGTASVMTPALRRDFALAWAGRFLIQAAAIAASAYLLVHLADARRAGENAEQWFATLTLTGLMIALVVGVVVGRWSDRVARRRSFLLATALLVSAGSALVGIGATWPWIVSGYALFAIGLTGFLTIDGAVIAELIGRAGSRGARLGIMNLTNTVPALVVPVLALLFDGIGVDVTLWLFLCAAMGTVATASLVSMMRTIP